MMMVVPEEKGVDNDWWVDVVGMRAWDASSVSLDADEMMSS